MKKITDKQYEEFQKYLSDKRSGRVMTADALRLICQAYGGDPEQIGRHFLEVLAIFGER